MKILLTFPARRQGGNAIMAHWQPAGEKPRHRLVGTCSLTSDRLVHAWRAVLLVTKPGEPDDLALLYGNTFSEMCDQAGQHLRQNGPWWM